MTKDEAINILKLQSVNPTNEEIIAQYRKLSRKYHPDLYQSADDNVKEVMHEKFIQITSAKDYLINNTQSSSQYSSANSNYSGGDRRSSETIRDFEGYMQRRQFEQAQNLINSLISSNGESPYLLELRIRLALETQQYQLAYADILKIEKMDANTLNDPDFQHYKTIIAAHAGDFETAYFSIDKAISLLRTPAPAFLATKAHVFIMQGRVNEADEIIKILERYDPNHPLVQQRRQVFNVGGNYMSKSDAGTNACFMCAILECLFDCC
ncbi:MAG: DnaJ domain-containing protein [bacterium]